MDHLPTFSDTVGKYPRVPLLCRERYDNLPFAQYPSRRGYDLQRLYSGDFSQHPREDTASFLQTWLYFGTLNEIFKVVEVDLEHFIERDDLGFRICTKKLDGYITRWATQVNSLANRSGGHEAILRGIGYCLSVIHKIYQRLSTCPDSVLAWEVTLSFSILGCTLDHALQWLWRLDEGRNWDLNNTAAARML